MKTIRGGQRVFRSVEEWKSALMTLPDNSFFELLRSILGNIKTPFSKQKLLNDLINLLSREEIQKTINAYIDEQDHKLITAVALLNEPTPRELETFFAGECSAAELHSLIINLEERLILYRFRESSSAPRLALNPVLEQVLVPFAADTRPLFYSEKDNSKDSNADTNTRPKEAEVFIPDARIMAALFAFIRNEGELFKTGTDAGAFETEHASFRLIRKKTLDEGKKIFPALNLDLVIRTFLQLGLFRQEALGLVPCSERVKDYCELSADERQKYWAAGVYFCLHEVDTENRAAAEEIKHFSWSRLRWLASFIHRFLNHIEHDRIYPESTLRRLLELLGREKKGDSWPYLFDSSIQLSLKNLLLALEKTGLLEKKERGWKAGGSTQEALNTPTEERPVIVMDAAFSFILYPEIFLTDALALGVFCSVKEKAQTTIRFEITQQSAARGFDQGMKAETMIELLNRLSLKRLDANIAWTLQEWERRYAEVSLHHGIVLTLAEDRRYLAEAGPVLRLIEKTLAPGVYLLSSGEKEEVAKALRKAGVDIVAQPSAAPKKESIQRNTFNKLGSDESRMAFVGSQKNLSVQYEGKETQSADSIKEHFRQGLDKMRRTKTEQDELLARIERRIILSQTQLEGTSLRYEKLEARGLDYSGKATIAKQAVEAGSLVEISWPGQGGELNCITGKADALEKQEGESILVVHFAGDSEHTERVIRIPLRKISLLRRIKQSIFGE